MNLLVKNLKISFLVSLLLGLAREAHAQVPYTFLRPLPNFPGTLSTDTTLTAYLQNAFYLILGLSATAAVVIAIMYGFAYMTSDVVIKKESAKKHLTQVALGIGLLLAAYLILYTINPKLVNLDAGLSQLRTEVRRIESPNARVGNGSQSELGRRELNNTDPTKEFICQRAQGTLSRGEMGPYQCEVRVFDPEQYTFHCAQLGNCNPVDAEVSFFRSSCATYGGFSAQNPRGGSTEYCACRADSACAQVPY